MAFGEFDPQTGTIAFGASRDASVRVGVAGEIRLPDGAPAGSASLREALGVDFLVGHLAASFTDSRARHPRRRGSEPASPDTVRRLAAWGFDAVSVADPHLLDGHSAGLYDTLVALDAAGIRHAGAGDRPRDAYSPAILEKTVRGKTVRLGLLSFSCDVDTEVRPAAAGCAFAKPRHVLFEIGLLRPRCDALVVFVRLEEAAVAHPAPFVQSLFRKMAAAGADIVAGIVPGRAQGVEARDGRLIAYSLGRFCGEAGKSAGADFAVAADVCSRRGLAQARLWPVADAVLRPESERAAYWNRLAELSAPLADARRMKAIWRTEGQAYWLYKCKEFHRRFQDEGLVPGVRYLLHAGNRRWLAPLLLGPLHPLNDVSGVRKPAAGTQAEATSSSSDE